MIVARFYGRGETLYKAEISGHAGYAEHGSDIVCAAVTSAVQLTCNTVTDVLHEKAEVSVGEDRIVLCLREDCSRLSYKLLEGLYEHLRILQEQYPGHVKATKEQKRLPKDREEFHHD